MANRSISVSLKEGLLAELEAAAAMASATASCALRWCTPQPRGRVLAQALNPRCLEPWPPDP